jgi:succinate dehydrogenase / fumarate reductase cytochrome b subunit
MQFLKSSVGRKMVMSITGLMMVLFVVVHLLGNSSVFVGPDGINVYATKLHGLGPFVWMFRLVMLTMFSLHVFYGIQLTLENDKAKPQGYAVKKSLQTTFAAKNMIWTGVLIAAFLIYHLLHFTFQVISPEIAASRNMDAMGRPDVFRMVLSGFQQFTISLMYVGAMVALAFHLTHGIQSFFQTLGLNNDRTRPVITKAGTIAAIILSLGYVSIPIIIFLGILKG